MRTILITHHSYIDCRTLRRNKKSPSCRCNLLAHNRLNHTRALLKIIPTIKIQKTPRSGPGKLLTLVGYSIVLPKIDWSQAIYIWVTISLTTIIQPPTELRISVFVVWGWWKGSVVKWWCCSALCVDAGKIDIYLKNINYSRFCTVIGHKTWFNVVITTFENRCVSITYLMVLRTIFDTT